MTRIAHHLVLATLVLLLPACGSGSGTLDPDESVPEDPVPQSTADLVVSGGTLTPSFDPATTDYAMSLGLFQNSLGITPSAPEGTLIRINGQPVNSNQTTTVAIPVGATSIEVTMTAQDGATTAYNVVVTRAASASEDAFLKASNADLSDQFGGNVAIDGDTLVVGAQLEDSDGTSEDNNDVEQSGAVYVFVRDSGTWRQQAYLKAPNPATGGLFGSSVAIDGDTIVVGAAGDDGPPGDSVQSSGAAFVYVRDGEDWVQQAYLQASNRGTIDSFGTGVAIHGDTIVVGAATEDSDGSSEANNDVDAAGAAYVFARTGIAWTQQAYLKSQNPTLGGRFGQKVAVHGDTAVVGAYGESSMAGAAYVFVRSGSAWTPQAQLQASNMDAGDWFGYAVAVHGDTVAVGAHEEDSDGSTAANNDLQNAGAVYVFVRTGTTWAQQAYLKAESPDALDQFGFSVSLDADALVAGARFEDSNGPDQTNNDSPEAGAAFVFLRDGATWSQADYLKASNPGLSALFGSSVSISDGVIAVGALWESSNVVESGAAYVMQ